MKKNLIFVIASLEIGGTERHFLQVLPRLAAAGWNVRVITTIKKGILAPDLEKTGIPVLCILNEKYLNWIQKLPQFPRRLIRMLCAIVSLRAYLKRNSNVTLHCFLPEPYIVGMLAARLARFKGHKIMSRRALNCYQQGRPLVRWLEKRLHTKTSMITGNCAALISQLHEEEKVPKSRLRLIYNGIDTTAFTSYKSRQEVRTLLGIPLDALVLIKVANLIPYKAHLTLLTALNKIKNKLPIHWRLICVGRDNGIGGNLQNQAKNLGLSEHILWLGMRQDIPDLLFSADIGVLCPYENEGFSNAILEGMAAGLPLVVTDVGGNKEAVVDGKTGYIVEANNSEALGNAILDLTNHPEKALQFGQAGQARVKKYFSLDACVQAYEELYESVSAS